MKHQCPVCETCYAYDLDEQLTYPAVFPFCSDRCKLIDLGAWLDADYRIPAQPAPGESSILSDDDSEHVVF